MGMPQARIGDMHLCTTPIPFSAPILPPGAVTVMVSNMPAARVGPDMSMTGILPPGWPAPVPHNFIVGSFTVLINNMPALRIGDTCMYGGKVMVGAPTVLTG